MNCFVDREQDLADLNRLLQHPDPQFLILYGRRRVGKTTLLLKWAQESGRPYIYWVASRDTPANLRQGLANAVWSHVHGEEEAPEFKEWERLFSFIGQALGDQPVILIMDEFAYAASSDSSLPSKLHNAWDHIFKQTDLFLVVAGSHIGMMVELQKYQAPLYGRFTARLRVAPMPFCALKEFFPRYRLDQRIAVYAILGGIPAYLERFDDRQTIAANVQREILDRTGMFRLEPYFLLSDEVREPRNYLAVLKAVATGHRTMEAIATASGIERLNLSPYLRRLRELYFIERETPATVPEGKSTTTGRYRLRDNYLRFYFRFIAPNEHLLEQGAVDRLWEKINDQMRAFVGMTAFEDLCRQWVIRRAVENDLSFLPDRVGSHWSKKAQVDVVAIRWEGKQILLGEAKWSPRPASRQVLTNLLAKVSLVVPDKGEGWTIHYALFARGGFTGATRELATKEGVRLVDLPALEEGLQAICDTISPTYRKAR